MNNFFLSFLNGYDTLFKALLTFIILDYISGVLKAIYTKKLSSQIGAKGIIKKIGYIVLIIVVEVLDILLNDNGYLRNIIISMFIANEGISILENWKAMDIKIPDYIKDKLLKMKGGDESEQNK